MLQAAIQGRLTQQLPEDGSAEDLYKKIQAEKQSLIKEGKIKKEKQFSEIAEDDIPFDIPENWKWVRLGNVSLIARGGSPRPIKEFITNSSNGINWIKIGDTEKKGKYINSCKEKIKPSGMSKSRLVHPGDFLLTNSMSFGRPYITNIEGCVHDGWLVISMYEKYYNQDFLYYLLSSGFAYTQFCDVVSGAVVKNLNIDKVCAACFPLPPISEQKRIVARVDELLARIDEMEKTEKDITELYDAFPRDMKASLLQAAIQGKLTEQLASDGDAETLYQDIQKEKQRLIKEGKIKKEKPLPEITEDDIPFDIPENWKWVHIKSIATIQYGFPFDSNKFNEIGSGMPLIRIRDVLPGLTNTYTTEAYSPEYVVSKGDMLVGMDGNFNVNFWASYNGVLNQRVCRIKANERIILQRYLYYYLPIALGEISDNVSFCTVKHLSDKHFSFMLIPLPPLDEQKRIVEKLDQLLPLCDSMKEAIDATA